MWQLGLAAVIVLSGLSCRFDRDDLYSGIQSDAGPDGGVALTPYEAALRVYGDDAECVACIERECADDVRACADDAACAEDAACRAGCAGDPGCEWWKCTDLHLLTDRPTHPLEKCLVAGCLEACRVGEDFDCAGKYALPEPQTDAPVAFTMQLMAGFPVTPLLEAGIRARVCAWPDVECREPVGEDSWSDAMGLVSVEFPPATYVAGHTEPFVGYVELSDPDGNPPRIFPTLFVPASGPPPQGPPRANLQPWWAAVIRPSDQPLFETIVGTWASGTGVVFGTAWDCRLSETVRGTGVTIEIAPSEDRTRVFYALGVANTETNTNGSFQAVNAPPGVETLTAFHAGEEYGRFDVPVRADAFTNVFVQVPGR